MRVFREATRTMKNPTIRSEQLPNAVAVAMTPTIRRIAISTARRVPPGYVTVDELVSAGYLGLLAAYRCFDPAASNDFEKYASYCIHLRMKEELRQADPLRRTLRSRDRAARRAERALEVRNGEPATVEQVAAELDMTVEAYLAMRAALARATATRATVSLDEFIERSGDEPADAEADAVDEIVAHAEAVEAASLAIAALPVRLQQVIRLHHDEERTLREIGSALGVTESRACQLHSEAIRRLRIACAAQPDAAMAMVA